MIPELFPVGVMDPNEKGVSVQSLLFGHRIKPQQTRQEYLVEFLLIAMAKKNLKGGDRIQPMNEMFIVSNDIERFMVEYHPISYMGLKRFIFFDNSRLDTKSPIDDKAYKKCVEIMRSLIDTGTSDTDLKESIFILQNILYGFSIENAGRSWFNKNLLPVCPEVLFPESLARQNYREKATIGNASTDTSFDYHSYTYMARGGEVYYLHVLHAVNHSGKDKREKLEQQLRRLLRSTPQLSKISRFIEENWLDRMGYDRGDAIESVTKTTKAIPTSYEERDALTVSELTTFLDNRMQPMEKLDLLSYGIVLQIIRMMITAAAKGSETSGSVWVIDVCDRNKKEYAEIRKLAAYSFSRNEESITKYIDKGITYYFNDNDEELKQKRQKGAEDDSIKVIRKLGKNMGFIIPMNGSDMRFTLSEEIIKFLVLSLIPAGTKVTFDKFLDMLYDHFEIVVSPEHYSRAVQDGKTDRLSNVSFLQTNKSDFAQRLKDCGFLRDLSDATSIVENPYEREEDVN